MPFEGRTNAKTDPAKDAVNIRIYFFTFFFFHPVFLVGWDRFPVEIRFYFGIVFEEGRHIDNEVTNHREIGKRFNESRFPH
jgi:hypothetical protein